MRIQLVFLCILVLIFGCNRIDKSKRKTIVGLSNYKYVEKRIVALEDTLHYAYRELMENHVDTIPINTIHLLEKYYQRAFQLSKKQKSTFEYLDKLQQLYTQEKKYALAIAWTDSLLFYAPHYTQKASLLLNAATTTEIYMKDQKKALYYYNRLLKEHPRLKKEVVEMVELRLKNLNKS